jgi:hypothetical protein
VLPLLLLPQPAKARLMMNIGTASLFVMFFS